MEVELVSVYVKYINAGNVWVNRSSSRRWRQSTGARVVRSIMGCKAPRTPARAAIPAN